MSSYAGKIYEIHQACKIERLMNDKELFRRAFVFVATLQYRLRHAWNKKDSPTLPTNFLPCANRRFFCNR